MHRWQWKDRLFLDIASFSDGVMFVQRFKGACCTLYTYLCDLNLFKSPVPTTDQSRLKIKYLNTPLYLFIRCLFHHYSLLHVRSHRRPNHHSQTTHSTAIPTAFSKIFANPNVLMHTNLNRKQLIPTYQLYIKSSMLKWFCYCHLVQLSTTSTK